MLIDITDQMETLIRTIFPGLIERIQLQIRAVRKIKKLERMNAITPRQSEQTARNIERYKRFYDSVRFAWDDEAENL